MKMTKEEMALRKFVMPDPIAGQIKNRYFCLEVSRRITAMRRAVVEDICQQVSDAVKIFPHKTQVKLMDAIMRYEKPKSIRSLKGGKK